MLKGLKVRKEKWLGTGNQYCVSDGKKRAVFTSSFLRDSLESALYQEVCLTSFGAAALCFFALIDADVTEITFGEEDKKIFDSCTFMIDNNDLSLSLDDNGKEYLHIPLAKQWQNKFSV